MNPTDTTDMRNRKSRSGGYAFAGAAALLVIAVAIWANKLSETKKAEVEDLNNKLNEERLVVKSDIVLHTHFRKLQQLDEKYAGMVMNSPDAGTLERLNAEIRATEAAMKKSLDSISKESVKYYEWANVVMSDSMVAAFNKALANRKYIANIRNAIEGKPLAIDNGDREMMKLEFTMQQKDEEIAALEKELKKKTNTPVQAPQATATAPFNRSEIQKKNEQLQLSLHAEEMRSTGLLDINRTLKQDNEKLIAELARVRRGNAADDASTMAVKNKMASLQDQVDDLNAELNFARIDCNLTRADAKKIISNSRQRKELLAQALQALQNLNRSDDAAIQKRAKEKLAELNQIASTVRD